MDNAEGPPDRFRDFKKGKCTCRYTAYVHACTDILCISAGHT